MQYRDVVSIVLELLKCRKCNGAGKWMYMDKKVNCCNYCGGSGLSFPESLKERAFKGLNNAENY